MYMHFYIHIKFVYPCIFSEHKQAKILIYSRHAFLPIFKFWFYMLMINWQHIANPPNFWFFSPPPQRRISRIKIDWAQIWTISNQETFSQQIIGLDSLQVMTTQKFLLMFFAFLHDQSNDRIIMAENHVTQILINKWFS